MHRRLSVRLFSIAAAGLVGWACASTDVDIGQPLDLQVSSNTPVSVSDSLVLTYDAQGRSLLGLVILWGDATLDSVFMNAAQRAGGSRGHIYPDTGSYTITTRLVDSVEGTDEKTLDIRIEP